MNLHTDVRIRPFERFLLTSASAVEISCNNVVFKLLTGGRFSSSVAMPVLSSTDKFTKLYRAGDDEMLRIKIGRIQGFIFRKFIAIAVQKCL